MSPTVVFSCRAFVFLILAALYESWSLPFSVLLGTRRRIRRVSHPVVAGWKTTSTANRLVMLIGLAPKNAPSSIVHVEFASEYRNGKTVLDGRFGRRAASFASILMTSFAFIFECCRCGSPAVSGAGRPTHPRLKPSSANDRRLSHRDLPHPGNIYVIERCLPVEKSQPTPENAVIKDSDG